MIIQVQKSHVCYISWDRDAMRGVGGISVASSEQMPNNVHVIVINYPPLSLAGKIK